MRLGEWILKILSNSKSAAQVSSFASIIRFMPVLLCFIVFRNYKDKNKTHSTKKRVVSDVLIAKML